ncbi:MAG TPA: SDR family NAD(P)-dependent oxidoreductase [Herpetosiphonaceae bacterium]|nr:SDR family NAD(P)-dependent oxidoreductase [Herpetosiphonaceae bacterium]
MNLVFITGGSRGLGAALLERFRAAGWTAVDLSRSGAGADHLAVDLGDLDSSIDAVAALFAERAQAGWEHAALINNAATVAPIGPLHRLEDSAIARSLDINMAAGARVIAAFVRAFQAAPGRRTVANISSGAANKANIGWSLYCAAKAGMEQFINVLAMEQAASANPIVCVNIDPDLIDTNMQREIRSATQADFPAAERFIQYRQSGRLRSPDAVAAAIQAILLGEPEQGRRYAIADV